MFTKNNLALLLAVSGVYASPVLRRDECSDRCSAAYNTCRGQPNANRSQCASEYSSCLGYVPFNSEGSLVTPTACSSTAAATPTGDACVANCNTRYNSCRTAPNANRAQCASEYSSCLGYVPFNNEGSLVTPTACSTTPAATPTGDACVADCNTRYNSCRTAPNANRAECASEYSTCLGYVPFNNEGSLVTPTACSTTAAPTAAPTHDACVEDCNNKYNSCRTAPNANRAQCASEYSGCLGYVPFNSEGSLVTPTACSTTPAPTAAPAPTQAAQGEGWTVKDLTRYCAEDKTGCDYNFKISTNDGQADTACTVIRTNVADAPTESWYGQPCTSGSKFQVSWGYSTQFATPFAVLTVVDTQKNAQAYFGVNNPTGQEVTPSNPYGSGNFGSIGPQPVVYN